MTLAPATLASPVLAIIGAMDEEVSLIRDQLHQLETIDSCGVVFYRGLLQGCPVVLLRSGIGKVAAALSTTLLLERFQPRYVVNIGSAGGFDPKLKVGDVVIGDQLAYHDVDVTAFGYAPGQLPGQPLYFQADAELVALAERCLHAVAHVQSARGLICSGDVFMADPERVAAVRQLFPAMQAVEMEGAAIAHVCQQFAVPYVVIRGLSDIAGQQSSTTFDEYLSVAARHSSLLVAAMATALAG